MEVTRHINATIAPYLEGIGDLQKSLIVAKIVCTTQKVIMIKQARFKVTTCLYLNPNIKARSLSTLIAVIVNKDAKDKIARVAENMIAAKRQIFQCSLTTVTKEVTHRGSEIRPTQRSVTARPRSKSLDGGCSEHSLS